MQFAKQIKGNLFSPVVDVMFRGKRKSRISIPVGVDNQLIVIGHWVSYLVSYTKRLTSLTRMQLANVTSFS